MMTPTLIPQGRRTHGPHEHLVPLGQLKPAILRHLESAPRRVDELANLVGYASNTVRQRLLDLESELRVHRVQVLEPRRRAKTWVWHAGAGQLDLVVSDGSTAGEVPHRPVMRTYPVVGRRDDLVAALFGAAGVAP